LYVPRFARKLRIPGTIDDSWAAKDLWVLDLLQNANGQVFHEDDGTAISLNEAKRISGEESILTNNSSPLRTKEEEIKSVTSRSYELNDVFISFHGAEEVKGQILRNHIRKLSQNLRAQRDVQSESEKAWANVFLDEETLFEKYRGDLKIEVFKDIICHTKGGIGLVLLSPTYFKSWWCQQEFTELFNLDQEGKLTLQIFAIGQSIDQALECLNKAGFKNRKTIPKYIKDDSLPLELLLEAIAKAVKQTSCWECLSFGETKDETLISLKDEVDMKVKGKCFCDLSFQVHPTANEQTGNVSALIQSTTTLKFINSLP
jgi:hypothetical protein